jgi:hypothetical protein
MKNILSLFTFAVAAFLLIIPTVSAQVNEVQLINPIGGKAIVNDDPAKVTEAARGTTDMTVLIGGIIQTALGLIGSITLLVFVYGGFLWLTSGGSADAIKKGKNVMLWAAIGVFIIFASYAILGAVLTGIGATGFNQ